MDRYKLSLVLSRDLPKRCYYVFMNLLCIINLLLECMQVSEPLSVHPLQLDFSLPEPKKLHSSSCSLHLTNNGDVHVTFRFLPSETLSAHFLPQYGVVPPKCRYTLAVTMRHQRNPPFGSDNFFTLESTKARDQGRRFLDRDEVFTKARERGRKVHEVKIAAVYADTEVSSFSWSPNEKCRYVSP